jgi:sulfoxide reductase heme-binding subunit YedZ
LCLAPLALLVIEYYVGRLGPNPIREIQLRTGSYTLFLLVASLACTPLYTLTGISRVLDLRRVLGLYAFSYAALHFMNLVGLDYQFDFEALWRDIAEKRYILAGFPAFLVLLILAITSTTGWKRRLGKNWKRLHRLVYLAGVLAVLHYFWQVKVSVPGPTVYAAILVVLLLLRLPVAERLAARRLPWRTS